MRKILLLLYVLSFSTLLGHGEVSPIGNRKEIADATDAIIINDDEITCASFRTEINKSQDYYLAFRVLPAWLNDNHFTSFDVYIDQKKVGTITPKCHGWQNLPIDGVEKYRLSEGDHVISLTVPYGVPLDVEKVYVLETKLENLNELSKEYDAFLEACSSDDSIDFMAAVQSDNVNALTNGTATLPLSYTFYSFFDFVEGDEVYFSIYSSKAFAADLVYWGCNETTSRVISINADEISPMAFTQPIDPVEDSNFKRATEKEKAGLTWTRVPIYSPSSQTKLNKYSINSYIHIPKKGRYYFRIRSTNSGSSGFATVNVSPRLSSTSVKWENVPFSNSMQIVYLPIGEEFTAFTQCEDPEDDKPIIFLEMYLGNLIQNYSDNKAYQPSGYKLGTKDVSIKGKSDYPMGVISVNNRISERPVSSYKLVYSSTGNQKMINEPYELADINNLHYPNIKQHCLDAQIINQQLCITNLNSNGILFVYDLKGTMLANITLPAESSFTIPISELGINDHGLYIIKIACGEEVKVMKFIK